MHVFNLNTYQATFICDLLWYYYSNYHQFSERDTRMAAEARQTDMEVEIVTSTLPCKYLIGEM